MGRTASRIALLGVLALYAFSFQGSRGLWDPDEGRYVDVALEMGRLGDYLSPYLHHEVLHLSKPPLTYWTLAASMRLFGTSEWAARVPNALAFLATILLVAGLSRRLAPGSSIGAAWIYALSWFPYVAANLVTTDTLLTLWETLAVYGFGELWWGRRELRSRYRLLMWLGFALAFLTKGPPGLLPLLAIVVFVGWSEGWMHLRELVSVPAVLLFGIVGLGWYLVLIAREPGALSYLVRYELFDRVLTDKHHRNAAWYGAIKVYLPIFILGSLPWTGALLSLVRKAWRSVRGGRWEPDLTVDPRAHFIILWLLLPLSVFCLARSRLPLYVLPLFVPLSLLVTRHLGARWKITPRRQALLAGWILFLVAFRFASALVPYDKDSRALARAIQARVEEPVDEVVFIEHWPRYGLASYLDTEVEVATLYPESVAVYGAARSEPLSAELETYEGDRLFLVPRNHTRAFGVTSRSLGYAEVPLGEWHDLCLFRLRSTEAANGDLVSPTPRPARFPPH